MIERDDHASLVDYWRVLGIIGEDSGHETLSLSKPACDHIGSIMSGRMKVTWRGHRFEQLTKSEWLVYRMGGGETIDKTGR